MNLSELHDRALMVPTLEKRMAHLQKEIQTAEDNVSKLLWDYEQESRDVEQIRIESLSSFLYKLVGKYEDKLEKEQREEINAKLAYDSAVTHLDNLKREKDELAARISSLRADENAYKIELENRRRELSAQLSDLNSIQYIELKKERNNIISQITEVKEALNAAARVKSTAQKSLESLKSAEGWATYDLFARGGIISHMAKYSHLDNAEQCFHVLSSQLRELNSELNDVEGLSISGLNEISSGQRIIDFWFDNIFTDLSVRGKIKDNSEQIRNLLTNINALEATLNSRQKQLEAKLTENKRLEEEILITMR